MDFVAVDEIFLVLVDGGANVVTALFILLVLILLLLMFISGCSWLFCCCF